MSGTQHPWRRRLRRNFITGLIVIAPVGLTVWVLWSIFKYLDGLLGGPLQQILGFRIPGLGFLLLFVVVVLVGSLVRQAAGRQLLHWWNEALSKFPLTSRIYGAVSQVVQTVMGSKNRIFSRTVLIPYPTDDVWAVAFVTHESSAGMARLVGEPCVNVFVPTTPNPTSGFMLIVPLRKIRETDISVEDAMKLIISAGAVAPGEPTLPKRRGLDLESLLRDTLP